MDDLFKMLCLLPNLRDLHLEEVYPLEDLRVDPPWLHQKFALRSLSFRATSAFLARSPFRDTCVSEVLGLFESVYGLCLFPGVGDDEPGPWITAVPRESARKSSGPSTSASGPETLDLIHSLKLGILLDCLFSDLGLPARLQGVRHLDLPFLFAILENIQRLNRLLTYLPALESLEVGLQSDDDSPLDAIRAHSACTYHISAPQA